VVSAAAQAAIVAPVALMAQAPVMAHAAAFAR
jgi:hypothetical protein